MSLGKRKEEGRDYGDSKGTGWGEEDKVKVKEKEKEKENAKTSKVGGGEQNGTAMVFRSEMVLKNNAVNNNTIKVKQLNFAISSSPDMGELSKTYDSEKEKDRRGSGISNDGGRVVSHNDDNISHVVDDDWQGWLVRVGRSRARSLMKRSLTSFSAVSLSSSSSLPSSSSAPSLTCAVSRAVAPNAAPTLPSSLALSSPSTRAWGSRFAILARLSSSLDLAPAAAKTAMMTSASNDGRGGGGDIRSHSPKEGLENGVVGGGEGIRRGVGGIERGGGVERGGGKEKRRFPVVTSPQHRSASSSSPISQYSSSKEEEEEEQERGGGLKPKSEFESGFESESTANGKGGWGLRSRPLEDLEDSVMDFEAISDAVAAPFELALLTMQKLGGKINRRSVEVFRRTTERVAEKWSTAVRQMAGWVRWAWSYRSVTRVVQWGERERMSKEEGLREEKGVREEKGMREEKGVSEKTNESVGFGRINRPNLPSSSNSICPHMSLTSTSSSFSSTASSSSFSPSSFSPSSASLSSVASEGGGGEGAGVHREKGYFAVPYAIHDLETSSDDDDQDDQEEDDQEEDDQEESDQEEDDQEESEDDNDNNGKKYEGHKIMVYRDNNDDGRKRQKKPKGEWQQGKGKQELGVEEDSMLRRRRREFTKMAKRNRGFIAMVLAGFLAALANRQRTG